jgi:hypothetical protein
MNLPAGGDVPLGSREVAPANTERADAFYMNQQRRLSLMTTNLPFGRLSGNPFTSRESGATMGFRSGDGTTGFDATLDEMEKRFDTFANDMRYTWSNTFYDVFTGNIRNMGELWDSVTRGMLNSFAKMVSDMAAQGLWNTYGGNITSALANIPGLSSLAGASAGGGGGVQNIYYVRPAQMGMERVLDGIDEAWQRGGTPRLGLQGG